uniref:Immunoglobulin domain-containing protein n=1 Tax=Cynoglossus semilaevis TaxID=244447 RepID=A0A3P8UXW9_CYNSE
MTLVLNPPFKWNTTSRSKNTAPLVVSINVVEPGEDVTLTSPCHSKIFHWYKQRLGYTMDTVALNVDNRESSKRTNDSRITVSTGKDCTLTIRNVSKDDEATYFCFSGTMFRPSFASGIFLAVTGKISSFYCFLNTRGYHKYDVQCPGVDEVYWFRSETGSSHPGFIYTQGNREDERKSCVHTFCTLIGRSSDAGTSYCTEAMCGEILFGEGTTVDVSMALRALRHSKVMSYFWHRFFVCLGISVIFITAPAGIHLKDTLQFGVVRNMTRAIFLKVSTP